MKIALLSTVLCFILIVCNGAFADAPANDDFPPSPAGKTWKLVWSDEFNGSALDESKWNILEGRRHDGWWSPKAISLDGKGCLLISVLKDGDKFLDGCINTKGKFERAYGFYVARIRYQRQQGHWSAFWLHNDSVSKVGDEGRDGTEIDIMEKPWLDDRVTHNLHWDGYGKDHKTAGATVKVPGVMQGFHTFALLWTPDQYVFFVDGKETWRTAAGGVCRVPLYIKLSDETGPWGGDIKKASLPDDFAVDYVRVYESVPAQVPQKAPH